MIPRQPTLPQYPLPWVGAAAKATYSEVLVLNGTEGTTWTRIDVAMPTLLLPFRNDDLTGATDNPGGGGVLQFLDVLYSPEEPQPASPVAFALPSVRGACWLWSPGAWWILPRCGSAGGVGFGGKIPFLFVPAPDPSFVEAFLFARDSAKPPEHENFTIAATVNQRVLSVQQQLDFGGMRALQIRFAVANSITMRWRSSAGNGLRMLNTVDHRFDGPYLPIADLYLENTSGALTTVDTIRYR